MNTFNQNLTGKKVDEFTLALGEVSNHHHTVYGDIDVLEQTEYSRAFFVNGEGKLTHQEHDTMVFTDEIVVSTNQVEYDPFNKIIQKVKD